MKKKYYTSSDKVYNRLLVNILSGKIPAGEKLGEDAISATMKVSRTPVREAIHRLTLEGLLKRIPRCGCFVKEQNNNQLQEVFECRQILERQALSAGFAAIDDKKLAGIKILLRQLKEVNSEEGELELSLQLDDQLHGMIVDICPNKLMKEMILKLQQQSNPLRIFRSLNAEEISNITAERIELINAIIAGDKIKSVELLKQHIRIPEVK